MRLYQCLPTVPVTTLAYKPGISVDKETGHATLCSSNLTFPSSKAQPKTQQPYKTDQSNPEYDFYKFWEPKMSPSKTVRKLEVVSPVPADIDIANSVEPVHISEIAKDLNLSPDHYDLYGKYKAKVIALSPPLI